MLATITVSTIMIISNNEGCDGEITETTASTTKSTATSKTTTAARREMKKLKYIDMNKKEMARALGPGPAFPKGETAGMRDNVLK